MTEYAALDCVFFCLLTYPDHLLKNYCICIWVFQVQHKLFVIFDIQSVILIGCLSCSFILGIKNIRQLSKNLGQALCFQLSKYSRY